MKNYITFYEAGRYPSSQQLELCPVCGKRCYSERDAGRILNSLKRHHSNDHLGHNKEVPRRKYFCHDCGCFHLTHMTKYYSEDERQKRCEA